MITNRDQWSAVRSPAIGQAQPWGRIVTATARRAMAEEKARIMGRQGRAPSALEAEVSQREEPADSRRATQEKLPLPAQAEPFPFFLQRVPLLARESGSDDEDGWKPQAPRREKRTTPGGRVNSATVGAVTRRLMALERARVLGRVPEDPRAWALEQAAQRWAEARARRR